MLLIAAPIRIYAQSSSSTNYRVDQTIFGTGGELDAQSNSFRARQTAGELTIGLTESQSFRAYAGFNTNEDPYIEFVVTGSNIDLGYLDETKTSTAQGVFYVRAWQAGGYVIRTESEPPTNTAGAGDQIDPLASPTAPTPGTEQFGINLVGNTCPTQAVSCTDPFGNNPQQAPDGTFSFGQAAPNYDSPGNFTYNKGDVIAMATESTSITVYTISYIFNISPTTLAGQYNFRHVLVATGTY